jgi:arginine/lysine/ornithine decarboxylase
LNPIYIWPPVLQDWHIAGQIRPQQVREALEHHPEAAAVLITSPDYYGLCADVAGIASACHERGVPLLVDEAHGAHFVFHESLPPSAGHCGADIWVNSMHKTLPALTQTAVLHVKSCLIDIDRIRAGLQMVQTTSPSYILMASMDIARRYMVNEGWNGLDDLLGYILDLSQWIYGINGVKMMDESINGRCGVAFKDPTRLCFDVSDLGIRAIRAEELLRAEGVQVEMADLYNVVLITTAMDDAEDFVALKEAFGQLAASGRNAKAIYYPPVMILPHPVQSLLPREAALSATECIHLKNTAGRIAAQPIGLYPPGVPLVCPGEIIDENTVEVLLATSALGGRVFNIGEDKMIAVVREKAYE